MALTVVLVDGHALVRDCIKAILAEHSHYQVIGEAESGPEAVSLCRTLKPGLILMEIALAGMDGIETAAEVARSSPTSNVVIVATQADQESVLRAIRHGARAYITKNASSSELLDALHAAVRGAAYFSPPVAELLRAGIQNTRFQGHTAKLLESLTQREIATLRLIAAGKTNQEISDMLDVQVATVRTYRKRIMHKLRVSNAATLIRLALSAAPTYPAEPNDGTKQE